ncbi:MAG TPA: methyltransferase domain-containing protein [Acidimicrobiales bacterium]|nr:methyltransferase domain-containing protein [Acidimicrobiales bacterium]
MGDESTDLRRELVDRLREAGHVTDERVAEAFSAVPRETFLADHAARRGLDGVYRDEAIVIRRDPATRMPTSSSSQPAIMARMLEMLAVAEGHRVLEIGAGTGYNAALLARLVGRSGSVTSVELDRDLAAAAREALLASRADAAVVLGDGRRGAPDGPQVDRIVVTASSDRLHRAWFDQLVPGGLLVVPLRLSAELFAVQAVVAFRKVASGFDNVGITPGGFMALRDPGAAAVHPAAVAVTEATAAVDDGGMPLVQLSGSAVAALDSTARQRLAVAALGFGRRRPLDLGGAGSWSLAAYAALALPEERLVECLGRRWVEAHEHTLGVLDAVDGSLAVLVGTGTAARVEAYGGRGAERTLRGVHDRWVTADRPGVDRLALRVRYGSERPHAWRTLRRDDQWIALDWRPPS